MTRSPPYRNELRVNGQKVPVCPIRTLHSRSQNNCRSDQKNREQDAVPFPVLFLSPRKGSAQVPCLQSDKRPVRHGKVHSSRKGYRRDSIEKRNRIAAHRNSAGNSKQKRNDQQHIDGSCHDPVGIVFPFKDSGIPFPVQVLFLQFSSSFCRRMTAAFCRTILLCITFRLRCIADRGPALILSLRSAAGSQCTEKYADQHRDGQFFAIF